MCSFLLVTNYNLTVHLKVDWRCIYLFGFLQVGNLCSHLQKEFRKNKLSALILCFVYNFNTSFDSIHRLQWEQRFVQYNLYWRNPICLYICGHRYTGHSNLDFQGVIVSCCPVAGQKACDSAVCVQHLRIMDVKAHQTRTFKNAWVPPKILPLPPPNRAITGACYLPEPPGRKW